MSSLLYKRVAALAVIVLVVTVAFVFSAQKARSASPTASPKPAVKRGALQQAITVSGTLSGVLIDLETGAEVEHTMDVAEVSPAKRYGLLFGQDYTLDITVTNPNGMRTVAFGSFQTNNVFHIVTSETSTTSLRLENIVLNGRLLAEGNVGIAVTSALLPEATTMAAVLDGQGQGGTPATPPNLPDKPQERGGCSGRQHKLLRSYYKTIPGSTVDACPGPTEVTAVAAVGWQLHGDDEPDDVIEAACTDLLPSMPPLTSVNLSHKVTDRKNVSVSWKQQAIVWERKLTIRYYRQSDGQYTGESRKTVVVEELKSPEAVISAGEACPGTPPSPGPGPGPIDPTLPDA